LFRHLAVFAGGFTLEAAETVVEEEKRRKGKKEIVSDTQSVSSSPLLLFSSSVLDGVTSLVDKSLLISKEQADGEMRFRMLEVVREYALESLEKHNEAEAVRRSHAAFFLAFGEEAEPHLKAAEAAKWLDRLEDEHDNLRAALRWSLERDAQTAARLAAALRSFWIFHSHLAEGRGWLKAALEQCGDAPVAVRFKMLTGAGLLARNQGDYETARKMYTECLEASRAAGDLPQVGWSSRGLGTVAYQQGDFTAARKFYEEGLAISRKLDDNFGIAAGLNFLGDLERTVGNNAAAQPLFEESLAILRQMGNKEAVNFNLINLGGVAYDEGDYEAARLRFSEGLATAQELGHKIQISYSLDGFAALAAARAEWELAAQFAGAAEHLREQIGFEIEPAERRFRDTYTSELKSKMSEEQFTKAFEHGRKIKLDKTIALALD
jgi:non-specific serine/threonine protein kinase